jgi:serine/threonine protein kinase
MEFVDGFTTLVANLPPEETILWTGIQVADAIDALNTKGVVHCDLKPQNIATRPWLSDFRPFVKILDFGLATMWQKNKGYGSAGGTPGFAPPEQALGQISPRCDVFAHGVLMYWMLSGRLPYDPELFYSPHDFMRAGRPEPLDAAAPELQQIVFECLELDPDRRYPRMPTAPLLDILKATSASFSTANVDEEALLREAKRLFVDAGLSSGRERLRLYERSAEMFDELARVDRLPHAYKNHALKARSFARRYGGVFRRWFGR